MVSRDRILEVSRHAALVLRETKATERYRHHGYTRIDPFEVADAEDLPVLLRPLQDLLGAFVRNATAAGILVNLQRPPGLIHMTCAHELGHYFLGHETTADLDLDYGPNADPKEKEADWFAYQLLMPRNLISETMRRKGWSGATLRDPAVIYQLSLRLGTSFTATVWTLFRHDILDLEDARALVKLSPQKLKRSLVGGEAIETLSDVWVLDKGDRDLVLEPRPNDLFIVDLPSHASAGFLWSIRDTTAAGFVLRPLTVKSDERAPPNHDLVVGGTVNQRYYLEHSNTGGSGERLGIEFQEKQPWRPSMQPIDAFGTSTEFESFEPGLNPQTRERLVSEVASS